MIISNHLIALINNQVIRAIPELKIIIILVQKNKRNVKLMNKNCLFLVNKS